MRRTGQVLLSLLWLLVAPVLWFYDPWPGWVGMIVAAAWLAALPIGWVQLKRRRVLTAMVCLLAVVLLWMLNRPSNDRVWIPEQERMVTPHVEGDTVTLNNLRHAVYDVDGNRTINWYEQTYDLTKLDRMDFVLVPLSAWEGLAHTFVTFGFSDGEYLAISVESRREVDETFSPIPGLFRKYEMIYVVGDERDLLGCRSAVDKCSVFLFPIAATPASLRELFVSMLTKAHGLRNKPVHYNSLTRNCTTTIVRHMEELQDKKQPFDWRIVFPGYSADLVYELGLMHTEGDKPESWDQFRMREGVPLDMAGPAWSAAIRVHSDQ